jgi:hypothetical protein
MGQLVDTRTMPTSFPLLDPFKLSFSNTNGQNTHEEVLTVPGHNGNANQNHTKIPSLYCKNGYHQECNQQMLVRLWGNRNPHTLLVGM